MRDVVERMRPLDALSGKGRGAAWGRGAVISPGQGEVTLAERNCGLMLDRVENEVD